MDNDILKQIDEFQKVTNNLYESFLSKITELKGDLTPEQQEVIDKELKKADISKTLSEISEKKKELIELQQKLNGYTS